MRASKLAIRDALASDEAVACLVPVEQIHSTEKAVLPVLPAIELVAISSERTDRPLIKHQLSCEVTASDRSESGADETLDTIVAAVRRRLSAAEAEVDPIVLSNGETALVELGGVRWSVSAGGPSSVIRGAAIALSVQTVDEVGGRD